MNSAPRFVQTAVGLLAAAAVAMPAAAQQLWSVEEVVERPPLPVEVDGVVASASRTGAAGPQTVKAAAVQVEVDYLRLGMGYLELPLWNGTVIEAENAVFEDRGNGNLMWTGEVPGAGYESVVFTVQDGYLVGWFGEPGGPKYILHAGPDGQGTLAVEPGPTGDWCGVGATLDGGPVGVAAAPSDWPSSVTAAASPNSLDILVLYTEGTAHYWRVIGGSAVGIEQLSDYLNMVFRNGAIEVTANLIPVRWDPVIFNHPLTQGRHYENVSPSTLWHWEFANSPVVDRLRLRHKPDLIHFIPDVEGAAAGGQSHLRSNSRDPVVLTGWSFPLGQVFAHEIGHGLGGHHEPFTFGDRFPEEQSSEYGWPYRFGHTDLTSCGKREEYGDYLVCPSTVMSYGQDLWEDPERVAVEEPFYSSVRHKPNGWTIGVSGTSEVERVVHETVSVAAISGEAPWRTEQIPRRVIGARWTTRDTVRVTWSEDWRSSGEGSVNLALAGGADDTYWWWPSESNPRALDPEFSDENITLVHGSDGSLIGVDITGLRPGGDYRIAVRGPYRWDPDTETLTVPLPSDVFRLKARSRVSGSPDAASEIGARVTGSGSVRLYWRDNSRVESGYEVWYRKWSVEEPSEVWRIYGEALPARARYVDIGGLVADEEIQITDGYWDPKKQVWVESETAMRGRYSFVVVAYNDSGFSTSETFDFEFMPGPYPAPTASGEVTDCTTSARSTGVDLDGYRVSACLEAPDGSLRRAWDYGLEAEQSGLLYFFGRDNAEILVKVLDGCAINGYRWVYVAPVTDLSFRLTIRELGPRNTPWRYDSERRPQDAIRYETVGNPKGRTARTVSDTTAFPCTAAEIAAARLKSSAVGGGAGSLTDVAEAASSRRLSAGASTDCVPDGPAVTLHSGYTVSMCYETSNGEVGDARDWGLDSTQSGLLYFFDRNNVEVLIKVLDGCGVNRHRWVFVAPVTDLAFNLHVESPSGERWTHTNRLGETAETAADTSAFPCAASA